MGGKTQSQQINELLQNQKDREFAMRRQKFSIELSFLEAIFGYRFKGALIMSEDGIMPEMKLERIKPDRLRLLRKNLQGINLEEDFKKMGLEGVVVSKTKQYPEWLLKVAGEMAKKEMLLEYEDLVLRNKMIYFTFVGEQKGGLVAAIDVRDLAKHEEDGIYALRKKRGNNVVWREDKEATDSTVTVQEEVV